MSNIAQLVLLGGGAKNRRPAPVQQKAIAPPFDSSDEYGQVHTTLPSEQVIPPHFTDPLFLRADFTGTTIPGEFDWDGPIATVGSWIVIRSGRWKGLRIPFLSDANSTPPTMLMTPMLVLYPQDVIEVFLTLQAERGYDDIVVSPEPWNAEENGYEITIEKTVAWFRYLKDEWGFRTVCWRGGDPRRNPWPDPMLKALFDAKLINFYIHGKEVDSQMSGPEYDETLKEVDAYLQGSVPIGAHFNADGRRKMGYPQSAPDYIRNWSIFNGRVHLCQQLSVYGPDGGLCPAGLQGSAMYYGRKRVMGQGDGSLGPGAPDSRVIAFEIMSTAQLYGECSEEYGCLRSWEQLCGTRDDPRIPPVSGGCSGPRYPNGNPL